jgi:hypothetical protein
MRTSSLKKYFYSYACIIKIFFLYLILSSRIQQVVDANRPNAGNGGKMMRGFRLKEYATTIIFLMTMVFPVTNLRTGVNNI